MVKNGFSKWLTSTKFQVAVLGIMLLYLAPVFYKSLDPTRMAELIRDIVLGYFAARVGEPVVEAAVNGVTAWFKKKVGSANTEGE